MSDGFSDYNNAPAFWLDQLMQSRTDAAAIDLLLRETVPPDRRSWFWKIVGRFNQRKTP